MDEYQKPWSLMRSKGTKNALFSNRAVMYVNVRCLPLESVCSESRQVTVEIKRSRRIKSKGRNMQQLKPLLSSFKNQSYEHEKMVWPQAQDRGIDLMWLHLKHMFTVRKYYIYSARTFYAVDFCEIMKHLWWIRKYCYGEKESGVTRKIVRYAWNLKDWASGTWRVCSNCYGDCSVLYQKSRFARTTKASYRTGSKMVLNKQTIIKFKNQCFSHERTYKVYGVIVISNWSKCFAAGVSIVNRILLRVCTAPGLER